MFKLLRDAARLAIAGRLFRDNAQFFRRWLAGFLASVVAIAGLALFDPWLGMAFGGGLGGALLPWLLRDLKYR